MIDALVDLVARQQFGIDAEDFGQCLVLGFEAGKCAPRMRDLNLSGTECVDVDVLVTCQAAHQLDSLDLRPVPVPCRVEAKIPDHPAWMPAGTADATKTTIAARCAPADVAGFQHAHVDAVVFCQVVRGRQPRIPAADDRDVAGLVSIQRR